MTPTIAMRADAADDSSDIPARCETQNGSDLIHCNNNTPTSPTDIYGNSVVCENRPNACVLSVVRWPSVQGALPISFTVDDSGHCNWTIQAKYFPQFKLENSALAASLLIDAGGQSFSNGNISIAEDPILSKLKATGTCTMGADGIELTSSPDASSGLRFRIYFFLNHITSTGDPSGTASFSQLIDPASPPDIIPTTDQTPLHLTTGTVNSGAPGKAADRGSSIAPLGIQGASLHLNHSGQSEMTLVSALVLPIEGDQISTTLPGAPLTAEITGVITKKDGTAITSLDSLKPANCGGGGGGTTGTAYSLSLASSLGNINATPAVSQVPNTTVPTYNASVAVTTSSSVNSCNEIALPFAKNGTSDPVVGLECKYAVTGSIAVTNSPIANAGNVKLAVPASAGAFRILNSASLQNTLAPGENTTISVIFEPDMANANNGCTTSGGLITCQSSLKISTTPDFSIQLTAQAKAPTAVLKMEEVDAQDLHLITDHGTSPIFPASQTPQIDFGNALLKIGSAFRLYKVSNTGVRPLTISSLTIQDAKNNFTRSLSVYSDYIARTTKAGPWTIAPSGTTVLPAGSYAGVYFFGIYAPTGTLASGASRIDSGVLAISTDAGGQSANLSGSTKNDARGTLTLYVEDKNRSGGTPDLIGPSPSSEKLYLVKNQFFSFRQDTAERAVYLKQSGPSGTDALAILGVPADGVANGFKFTKESTLNFTGCSATALTSCPTVAAGGILKLGKIQFVPNTTGSRNLATDPFVVTALSKASNLPPIIGGSSTTVNGNNAINFNFVGANGLLKTDFDLTIRRLISGFQNPVNTGTQKSLIASTTTKGIVGRFNSLNGTNYAADTYGEIFKLSNGMVLNPITGAAVFRAVVTTPDPDVNNPGLPSAVSGLRLYNGPGSIPSKKEYYLECKNDMTDPATGPKCRFFYLYIGGWTDSTTVPANASGACVGKTAVAANPPTEDTTKVLNPLSASERACMSSGSLSDAAGFYDPVTGELTFKDLAVRLYAPSVATLSGNTVDATIRISLTTGCVDRGLVDSSANYLVSANTLSDTKFSADLMGGTNPLLPYVDTAGSQCGTANELHGRTMFSADYPNTLDDPSVSSSPNSFDIAGVGRNKSNNSVVTDSDMYIVIKAEVTPH
jgi:hypothetical protein